MLLSSLERDWLSPSCLIYKVTALKRREKEREGAKTSFPGLTSSVLVTPKSLRTACL